MLVRLGKLLGGEEKSKEGDIDIGVHDEVGALYAVSSFSYSFLRNDCKGLFLNSFILT